MPVKLLMTWNILPGREQEYFEFVVRDFIPAVQHMGLEMSDAWFTMYGEKPQIMASAQATNLSMVQRILSSTDWNDLTNHLLEFVNDFDYKVIDSKPGFQI